MSCLDLGPAGLKEHILWGTLMLLVLFPGPGRLCKRFTP